MSETVEIRFKVNNMFTPWEPETVRVPVMNQIPTAVARITELRQRHPDAAIAIERRGEKKPDRPQMFRFSIFVREGSMLVNDPNGVNGVSMARLDKATLMSKLFTESERDSLRAQILEQFPNAQLTEVRA